MSTWAAPGKQCVCINDNWQDGLARAFGFTPPDRVPMINEVLTISEVATDADYPEAILIPGGAALGFHEMDHDFMFAIAYFKPLVSEEDDVALFQSIVQEQKESA